MEAWITGLTRFALFELTTHLLRYFVIAGAAFGFFWVWQHHAFAHRRIQSAFPSRSRLWAEVRWSVTSLLVFVGVGVATVTAVALGWTQLYTDVAERGWAYLLGSVAIMMIAHDAYFYWAHRFMHWKPVFRRVHAIHHRSTNPSPWAAFAFHPAEALVEAGIIPILIFAMPLHPIAIALWLLAMTVMNVLGHLGYEVFPTGFTRGRITRWSNTSTHHNQHHRFVDCNYGLYYNWWDRWMGTNHPEYHERFEIVAGRARELQPPATALPDPSR